MEKFTHRSQHRPVISQAQNNTTLWIGQLHNDPADHFAGQTFQCPSEGLLDNIQVYSTAVQQPGHMELTLHEFEPGSRTWGAAMGQSSVEVKKNDHARWIQFRFPAIPLKRGVTYGFRLQASGAMIGLGEAATGNKEPFSGQEWNGDSMNQRGRFYTHFSLTFKVELCA